MDDAQYMTLALQEAVRGEGYVSPNPMVGAVVVKDDQVVGRGYHQAVGGPHAEVHALDDAAEKAVGATLYVTLEPCNHQGRTPPCTRKILQSGIKRVVVAMADPNPDVKGGGNDFLRGQGVEVLCGVKEREAERINEPFIKFSKTKLPFVVLKMAATLDGRIATRTGDAHWVTGESARARVHQIRHALDAIMVGVGTVRADDPQLTTRLENNGGVDPIRFVLDTRLSIPPDAKLLSQTSAAPTYLVCGSEAPKDRKESLSAAGARILEAPLEQGRIDLKALMPLLGQLGVTSLLVEGGAHVADSALKADVVDKVMFFYAPKILGGSDGMPMLSGRGPELMKSALQVQDVTVERFGEDILVQGYRKEV